MRLVVVAASATRGVHVAAGRQRHRWRDAADQSATGTSSMMRAGRQIHRQVLTTFSGGMSSTRERGMTAIEMTAMPSGRDGDRTSGDGTVDVDARWTSTSSTDEATWKRLTTLAACAIAICYADRSNISTAIIAMGREYAWDKTTEGLILSAFFYGYGATQIVGGGWADRAGGKATLTAGVVAWSAATAVTPVAAAMGVPALVVARIALGAGEGVAFPAIHALIAKHVPVNKRSTAVSAVTAASYAGAAFAFAVTPPIVSDLGWESAFYSFGALALVWLPFWLAFDPKKSSGNATTIEAEDDGDEETLRLASPEDEESSSAISSSDFASSVAVWRTLVSKREVRAICVAQFAQSWGMYGLLSWLPTYFNEAQGVDIADLPAFTFIPYILQGVLGLGVGVLADELIHVRGVSVKTVRRAAQSLGMVGPALALCVAASPVADGNPTLAAVSVDLGLALSALTLAGVSVSHLDVAPRHAGLVFATGNTVATLAGSIAVPFSGLLLDASDQSWSLVFAVIAAVYVFGAAYWCVNLGVDPVDDRL
jgi:ACS family sodium-dependent inorganic phosphate cotransporter